MKFSRIKFTNTGLLIIGVVAAAFFVSLPNVISSATVISSFIVDGDVADQRVFTITATDSFDTALNCILKKDGQVVSQMGKVQNKSEYASSRIAVKVGAGTWTARCETDSGVAVEKEASFSFRGPEIQSLSVDSQKAGIRTFSAVAPDFNLLNNAKEACSLYIDGAIVGQMNETGESTGVFKKEGVVVQVGAHKARIVCANSSNNTDTEEISWTVESFKISSQIGYARDSSGLYELQVSAPDFNSKSTERESACSLAIDNIQYGLMDETSANSGVFVRGVSLAPNIYRVEVTCIDVFGNTGYTENTLVLTSQDLTAPSIALSAIEEEKIFRIKAVVKDDREGEVVCSLTVDGIALGEMPELESNIFSYAYNKTSIGTHVGIVTCKDNAQNQKSESVTWGSEAAVVKQESVSADTEKPTIIEVTADSARAGLRSFSVRATDNRDIDLKCSLVFQGAEFGGVKKIVAEKVKTEEYKTSSIEIKSGTITLAAECSDKSGNLQSKQLSLSFTPQITSTAPQVGQKPATTKSSPSAKPASPAKTVIKEVEKPAEVVTESEAGSVSDVSDSEKSEEVQTEKGADTVDDEPLIDNGILVRSLVVVLILGAAAYFIVKK